MKTATSVLRCSSALRPFLIHVLRDHDGTVVRVERRDARWKSAANTVLVLAAPDGRERRWRLPRPPHEVTDDDLAPIRRSLVCRSWLSAWLGRAFRFGGWWLGFTCYFAIGSVCPCCGQAGCAMGIGAVGALGAAATLVLSKLKCLGRRPRSIRSESSAKEHAVETNRQVWGERQY